MASIESPDLLPDLRRQFHSVSRAFRQQEQTAALPVVPFVLLLWSEPGLWCSSIIIAPASRRPTDRPDSTTAGRALPMSPRSPE